MNVSKVTWDKLGANSYILYDNVDCIIIDSNKNTYHYVKEHKLIPSYIFLTHEHFDHIEGIGRIKKRYPFVKIVSSLYASSLLSDSRDNMSFYIDGIGISEPNADITFTDNIIIKSKTFDVQCFITKGHSEGSAVYLVQDMLFTGDTILNSIRTPITFPNSSKEDFIKTIDFIDSYFDSSVVMYPGHGTHFTKSSWNKGTSLSGSKRYVSKI